MNHTKLHFHGLVSRMYNTTSSWNVFEKHPDFMMDISTTGKKGDIPRPFQWLIIYICYFYFIIIYTHINNNLQLCICSRVCSHIIPDLVLLSDIVWKQDQKHPSPRSSGDFAGDWGHLGVTIRGGQQHLRKREALLSGPFFGVPWDLGTHNWHNSWIHMVHMSRGFNTYNKKNCESFIFNVSKCIKYYNMKWGWRSSIQQPSC